MILEYLRYLPIGKMILDMTQVKILIFDSHEKRLLMHSLSIERYDTIYKIIKTQHVSTRSHTLSKLYHAQCPITLLQEPA